MKGPGAAGSVTELGDGRLLVDLGFRDREGLIASYLLPGPDGWTLVETGPGSCTEALQKGVASAGIEPNEVVRILVTHIHLDHSGGLGQAAVAFPFAEMYAHADGVPHLADPARLIASARRAWGEAADPLWGPIPPVPSVRLHGLQGGERFDIQGGSLRVIPTPGHARHHLSFLDEATRSLMVGDSAGVRLIGQESARPAVPPPDLDLELLLHSLELMAASEPQRLLYAHYGPFPSALQGLDDYRSRVLEWKQVALAAALEDPSSRSVGAALRIHEADAGRAPYPGKGVEDRGELVSGYEMAAMGFLRYFRSRSLVPE